MLESIFAFFYVVFLVCHVLWIITVPFAIIKEHELFIPHMDRWLGKSRTNGILILKFIAVWLWPIALILAIPQILKWLKEPR